MRLRYFCSPQHTDSALYPIIRHMERAAGLLREDDPKAKLDKLDALLATYVIISRGRRAFGRDALAAERRPLSRARTCAASAPAEDDGSVDRPDRGDFAPVSGADDIEDAHWADPSSLEVFGRLVDKIDALRVLLFVTFRPEFAAPWIGRPHVTALTINRLAPREVMTLIERVAGNRPLPDNIRQDIVERADGIPLFVEEMTKAVLEAEDESAAALTVAAVPFRRSPSPRASMPR